MRDNGQKWHGWKSSKDKTTGDQRTQRPNSHQTQKTKICWISKYFGKIIILRAEYSKVGFKKKNFWKACILPDKTNSISDEENHVYDKNQGTPLGPPLN